VLITGGDRTLGALIARHLVETPAITCFSFPAKARRA